MPSCICASVVSSSSSIASRSATNAGATSMPACAQASAIRCALAGAPHAAHLTMAVDVGLRAVGKQRAREFGSDLPVDVAQGVGRHRRACAHQRRGCGEGAVPHRDVGRERAALMRPVEAHAEAASSATSPAVVGRDGMAQGHRARSTDGGAACLRPAACASRPRRGNRRSPACPSGRGRARGPGGGRRGSRAASAPRSSRSWAPAGLRRAAAPRMRRAGRARWCSRCLQCSACVQAGGRPFFHATICPCPAPGSTTA